MDDDPLLARLNAALREAEHLRAEALRVQREAAARVAEIRWSSTSLCEAIDRSLALRSAHPPGTPARRDRADGVGDPGRPRPAPVT